MLTSRGCSPVMSPDGGYVGTCPSISIASSLPPAPGTPPRHLCQPAVSPSDSCRFRRAWQAYSCADSKPNILACFIALRLWSPAGRGSERRANRRPAGGWRQHPFPMQRNIRTSGRMLSFIVSQIPDEMKQHVSRVRGELQACVLLLESLRESEPQETCPRATPIRGHNILSMPGAHDSPPEKEQREPP
ncbi:hypothetical protein Q8A67_023443 [Cirrhinus molitorella]|uniref:Uncharacterized protein n=1 Tax=Cirrhinus molitorella TaxID=172907 RepID=A0AA88P6T1_9TELE|nr:hypothetical protein Q8A67_023443 [Cirrhinus molitorella]